MDNPLLSHFDFGRCRHLRGRLSAIGAVGMIAAVAIVGMTDPAHADDATPGTVAQEKSALDATGQAGVPADWDPEAAMASAPTKQPAVAAIAAVADQGAGAVPDVLPGGGGSVPAALTLVENEVAQKNEAWCDPAAVHEALGAIGISLSQANAAKALGTGSNGTAWYLGSSATYPYPTRHVLNDELGYTFYYVQSLPDSPTSAEVTTYEQELVSDIGVSMPLIGNAYEVVGGPHLVGHPDENLQHYVEIRGYHQTGAQTNYEDSIHGNTQVGWYASVPAYSQMSSATFATILGDRGYVW